jgi:hypothetical protein
MNSDDENGESGSKSSLRSLLSSEFGASASLYDIIGASRTASPGALSSSFASVHIQLTH